MPFISNSKKERAEMLKFIGVKDFEELVSSIPQELRLKRDLQLSPSMSELEILRKIDKIKNSIKPVINFAGGGVYEHFIPRAVSAITSDPAFYTAYTPYQAEVSQGTLQAIFEYQSMICKITGMDVANASMYDGATAAAEAILMTLSMTRKNRVLIADNINPNYLEVIKTYLKSTKSEIVLIKSKNGKVDLDDLETEINDDLAAYLLQNPNYFGCLEEVDKISDLVHKTKKGKLIAISYPVSLAILKTPGEYGADIAVGEAQCLGNPLNFGGPLLGYFAVKDKLKKKIPGRVVGKTADVDGKTGFVLTMQTREQHIRRAKATSNICTNQALNALTATVYLSLLGKNGFYEIAYQSLQKAHYLADKICELEGFSMMYDNQFFNEFAIKTKIEPKLIINKLLEKGVLVGIEISDGLLIAVTEKRTKDEMDKVINFLKEF